MNRMLKVLGAVLGLSLCALIAAQNTDVASRDGYFWRLASDGGWGSTNSTGSSNGGSEETTYYYNINEPCQLDSMVSMYYSHFQYGILSIYTRTNFAGHYQIDEARYSQYGKVRNLTELIRRLYNWQGVLFMIQEYNSSLQLISRYECDYDATGNQIAQRNYNLLNNELVLTRDDLHAYDASGRLTNSTRNRWNFSSGEMCLSRVEEHFYGAYALPDSILYQHYAISTESSCQAVFSRLYNTFDTHGNIVNRLEKHTAVPASGGNGSSERNTCFQYVTDGQKWYPEWELSFGSFINTNDYYNLNVYPDSTLSTYTYADEYRRIEYDWQSYFSQAMENRITQYNAAGLMTALETHSEILYFWESSNHYWNWEYVNSNPPVPPAETRLSCAPNPFIESLELRLRAAPGPYDIDVFNIRGQLVRSLATGTKDDNDLIVTWDGKTAAGVKATCGVYLLRALTASGVITARVSLIY